MNAKNKGFTLIELLAVIVILAIIALIVTPVILNIIENAQNGADRRSVEQYAKVVKQKYLEGKIQNDGNTSRDFIATITKNHTAWSTNYDGDVVKCDTYYFDEETGDLELYSCVVGGRDEKYNYVNGKVKSE